jgi:hypothetical protein
MVITQKFKEVALLELLAKRALKRGDVVSMEQLETAWKDTSLRRSDLAEAILPLLEKGLLCRDSSASGGIALTEAGHALIDSGKLFDGTLGDYLRMKTQVDQAKNRRRQQPSTRSRRRLQDHTPPT